MFKLNIEYVWRTRYQSNGGHWIVVFSDGARIKYFNNSTVVGDSPMIVQVARPTRNGEHLFGCGCSGDLPHDQQGRN